MVYHVAAVGVVLELEGGKPGAQRHYFGHSDDILALNLHPNKDIVATAQASKRSCPLG